MCSDDNNIRERIPSFIVYYPIPIVRGISLFGTIKTIFSIYRIFKKMHFDLVQYGTNNASFCASIASFLAHVPNRVYCQWGFAFSPFNGFVAVLFALFERVICGLSTDIRLDSKKNLQIGVEKNFYKQGKAKVVWNGSASGVDLERFDIGMREQFRKEIRSYYHIADDAIVLGFVGRINADKGVNELLTAFNRIVIDYNSVILMLVGPYEGGVDNDLYSASEKSKNIIYTGQQKQVEKYYSAFDVFVLPSYHEGFGSVTIEAQAMGVPVVTTDIPGPSEGVKENLTGLLCKPKDVDSLYVSIVRLLSDKQLLQNLSGHCRTFVLEHFESSRLVSKLSEDLYGIMKS
jgi:glycosyltransferase involved in cell wall biosynthesis